MSRPQPPTPASVAKEPRIVIVGEHASVRDMLRHLVQQMGLDAPEEVDNVENACPLIVTEKPGLVILDMDLADLRGVEMVQRVRTDGFTGAILLLTSDERPYVIQRIQKMNISGAISKKAGMAIWREGILQVLSGKSYFCALFEQRRAEQARNPNAPEKLLTKRETEILGFIGLAKSDHEIASLLEISHRTVEGMRDKLRKKLRLRDTPQLVHFAQEQGYAYFCRLNRAAAMVTSCLSLAIPFLFQCMDDGLPDLSSM